jgi:predicted nuclease of predicted toxin-antitoxin system
MSAILLDSCVWSGALPALSAFGHDVVWSGSWPKDPGDMAIPAAAYSERRILVTLDKDCGELAILKGLPHSAIWLQGCANGKCHPTCHWDLRGGTRRGRNHNGGPRTDKDQARMMISPAGCFRSPKSQTRQCRGLHSKLAFCGVVASDIVVFVFGPSPSVE